MGSLKKENINTNSSWNYLIYKGFTVCCLCRKLDLISSMEKQKKYIFYIDIQAILEMKLRKKYYEMGLESRHYGNNRNIAVMHGK